MRAVYLATIEEQREAIRVAQQHGTRPAAEWLGVPVNAILRLRRRDDPTFTRGRGHPTLEEVKRYAPRASCNCPMCVSHRRTAEVKRRQALRPRHSPLLELTEDRPDWHAQANCSGMDPEVWFPGRGESTKDLKAICERCAVQAQCRTAGLVEKFGMWGGLSERERRRVRSARRRERVEGIAS